MDLHRLIGIDGGPDFVEEEGGRLPRNPREIGVAVLDEDRVSRHIGAEKAQVGLGGDGREFGIVGLEFEPCRELFVIAG